MGRLSFRSLCCVFAIATVLPPGAVTAQEICWRDSYGRGVGTIPASCDMYQEKSGLLCYPSCRGGFSGVAFVCWQDCASGFRDDGAFCAKPEPYGRGAGYPWQFGDTAFSLNDARARCERDNGAGNCEKSGEIIYPRCRPNFHNVGCCICSPDCPGGMTDIGVSCAKQSYTRETILPDCVAGEQYDAGLCYASCKPGYYGVGPVCWGECPASLPVDCGASCARSTEDCALAVTDQVVSVLDVAANIALTVATAGTGTAAKGAANVAAKGAVKVGAEAAARQSAKQAFRGAAKKGLARASRAEIKDSLRAAAAQARKKGVKEADDMSEDKIEKLAELLENAQTAGELGAEVAGGDPDPLEIAEILDPSGLIAVVNAYNRPICSDLATGNFVPSVPLVGTTEASVCAPPTPPAVALEAGMYYRLTTAWQGDGKSLDIVNDGTNNRPILAATANVSGQMWKLSALGDGHYRLTTAWQGDGKSLDIVNDGANNRPILADSGAFSGQMWKLSPLGDGFYRLTTAWQGDCKSLDILNDGANDQPRLAPGGNFSGQMWKLTPTGVRY